MTAKDVAGLRATLGGVAQEEGGGDNLAILLASYFEPGIESEELDDSGTWKQGAIDACDKVLDAIHAHYTNLIESQAKALSEACEVTEELRVDLAIAECLAVEANDRALAAESRLAEASTHITDLANELRAEIEVRYAGTLNYPSQRKKYQLDMEPVVAARDFLNAAKEKTNAQSK